MGGTDRDGDPRVTSGVRVRADGGVRTVTIDVPDRRNALSRDVLLALRQAIAGAEDVVAVVLTGNGGVFSAGADLTELTGTVGDLEFDDQLTETVRAVQDAPVPVLAAIEGPCIGAALELALACDLRICGADAWMQVPAVRLGILYNPAAIARLHRTLPRDTVTRLVLLGERYAADAAERAGLASSVVPAGGALAAAHAVATEQDSAPRDAVAHTKRLLVELDRGVVDTTSWQRTRETLLDSPARRAALDSAMRSPGGPRTRSTP